MPTIIRKISTPHVEIHREVVHAVSWQIRSGIWSPPTDVFETDAGYVVRVELAGMRESDFEVAYDNNILVINGIRSEKPEKRAYHQMEIRFGRFTVAVGLSAPVDVERSTAEYSDGFLTVTLPIIKPAEEQV